VVKRKTVLGLEHWFRSISAANLGQKGNSSYGGSQMVIVGKEKKKKPKTLQTKSHTKNRSGAQKFINTLN